MESWSDGAETQHSSTPLLQPLMYGQNHPVCLTHVSRRVLLRLPR
jgi:hypothetical protein